MSQSRKPPNRVRSISGEFKPDVITQTELRAAAEFQATVWLAEKQARECVQAIEARIDQGATVEPGEFIFDHELQMARSRKGPGSAGPPQQSESGVGS